MLNGLGDFYFMVGGWLFTLTFLVLVYFVIFMLFTLTFCGLVYLVIFMMSKQHDWEVKDPAWKNGPEDQEKFPEEPPHKEPEDDPEWVKHGSGMHNQHD